MSKHEFHNEFLELLNNGDIAGLAKYLNNAMRLKLTHGLGPGQQVFQAFSDSDEGKRANILILRDRLASLAEAIGGLPFENPEQGHYGENIFVSVQEIVSLVENKLGYRITRDPVMGDFGIAVPGGIINVRVPDDVYTIYRIDQLRKMFRIRSFAEIGAGLGGNALQAHRLGLKCTMFDLPVTSFVQAYYAIKSIGHDQIRLFGEPAGDQSVVIMPYFEFFNSEHKFDLVVNRDSLPEMPKTQAEGYISEIVKRSSLFLSINQESLGHTDKLDVAQLRVSEIINTVGGLSLVSRSPYWTRKGYVEELYLSNI